MDLKELAKKSIASQDKFELWQLLILLDHFVISRILEIGVHRGGMVETLAKAYPHATIVGIDNDYSSLKFTDFIKIEGDSHDPEVRDQAASHFGRHPVDFIFIDGDHTLESVRKDYEMYASMVKPGGIIAFHDIMRDPVNVPHHTGVDCRQFFDEIKLKHASLEIWNGTAGMDAPGIGVIFL